MFFFHAARVHTHHTYIRATCKRHVGKGLTFVYIRWAIHRESHIQVVLPYLQVSARPRAGLPFQTVCSLPLSQLLFGSVRLMTTSFSCLERRQLHLVPERSPHPDPMLGTLCRLSCVIHLCLWTVSNVHWKRFCSVRTRLVFCRHGARVTIFVNCAFFNVSLFLPSVSVIPRDLKKTVTLAELSTASHT